MRLAGGITPSWDAEGGGATGAFVSFDMEGAEKAGGAAKVVGATIGDTVSVSAMRA